MVSILLGKRLPFLVGSFLFTIHSFVCSGKCIHPTLWCPHWPDCLFFVPLVPSVSSTPPPPWRRAAFLITTYCPLCWVVAFFTLPTVQQQQQFPFVYNLYIRALVSRLSVGLFASRWGYHALFSTVTLLNKRLLPLSALSCYVASIQGKYWILAWNSMMILRGSEQIWE